MSDRPVGCAVYRELLDHYFDSELVERPALDAHAATCADCRAAFGAMTAELADVPCSAFVELVTEYLERSMTPIHHRRMDRHLELCEGCRAYLRQMHRTVELTAAQVARPDPGRREVLIAAFRAIRGAR